MTGSPIEKNIKTPALARRYAVKLPKRLTSASAVPIHSVP